MFDNVAFEVVIGLVFIYLLYSLLVTILSEIISNFIGIRARLLRVAIERMLNDGYYYKVEKDKQKQKEDEAGDKAKPDESSWRRGPRLDEHAYFRRSFAGKFYDYPAIKYLGRMEKEKKGKLSLSKPSYISAEYFADALINFMADKGTGATLMDKIGFCIRFNTYHIQPNTRRQFINLFESSATLELYKSNLMKWFNETMDRATGWHKRKMRVISFLLGLVLAMLFNIDSIKIAKILANDKEARGHLVNMGIAMAKDSTRYKEFTVGNGDSLHTQSILDTGFAQIKKDIESANLVLGLGWDLTEALTQDNIEVKSNDTSSTQLLKLTTSLKSLAERRDTLAANLKNYLLFLIDSNQKLDSLNTDTIIAVNEFLIRQDSASMKRYSNDTAAASLLKKQINILVARTKIDSGALTASGFLTTSLNADINKKSGKNYKVIDSVSSPNQKGITRIYGKRPYTGGEKFWYLLSHIFWFNLIGFLVTALALSMGAPFWFDLLNKLVSIRGAGIKPEEKKVTPVTEEDKINNAKIVSPASQVTPPAQDPIANVVEAALQMFTPQIKAIPGVKAVFSVTKDGEKIVQVNVDNAKTRGEVERLFRELYVGEVAVPFHVQESGSPTTHAGPNGMIANRSGKNGFGSLGCILVRRETGSKHILSCWHVLKGDLNYSGRDNEPFIIDKSDGNELAERWAGGIKDQFDYGLAKCVDRIFYRDNSFLKAKLGMTNTKLNYRFVSRVDVDKQIPVKYYNTLTDQITTGFIYTESGEVDINYIDKTRTIKDVLILTNDEETTISKEGNSGAVVFDEQNKAIAMIIAGDLKYSYAMKLSHIFCIHDEMDIA